MLLYHPQDKSILMRLGIPEANIELISNAIDMDEFDPIMDASDIITKCDLGSTKQILFVGRLIKRKGCEFIVRAMPKILKEVPNTKFLIVGDGPEEDTIKKLINNLGIEDSVIMFGYVKPLGSLIKKIYKSSDLLVLPSLDECMSRTILEAMSMKLPIITTKNWYSEWLVQPNKEAALLVNPYNITMLADAIIKILTDDELSKNLAEKGRYLIETAYNWKIIAKRTINLYEKCIKRTQKHF
jgi:glycosyltransferase involved in cell wall biosynthesis